MGRRKDDPEEKRIVAWTRFGQALCAACKDGVAMVKSVPDGIDETAVLAVRTFALSIGEVGKAKILKALLDDPKTDLPDDLVLDKYRPVVSALKGADEMKGVIEKRGALSCPAGLKSLLCLLKPCEEAASCCYRASL